LSKRCALSVLSNQEIRQLINTIPPLLSDFLDLESQVQPNGFDTTLHSIAKFDSFGTLGETNNERVLPNAEEVPFGDDGFVHLVPGCYLVRLNETVTLPNSIMALARPRSSLLRSGVSIHNAVWDAGYSGQSQALMVVYNQYGFKLSKNSRILQLVFMKLADPTSTPYEGTYQGESSNSNR